MEEPEDDALTLVLGQAAELSRDIRGALERFAAEVRSGAFPETQHTYAMPEDELATFSGAAAQPAEEALGHR